MKLRRSRQSKEDPAPSFYMTISRDHSHARLQEETRSHRNELCIINSVNAAIALGEATARAVQRIPDAHCNGDMHAALDYAQKVKHEQKNFLNEQALKHIIEEGEQTS